MNEGDTWHTIRTKMDRTVSMIITNQWFHRIFSTPANSNNRTERKQNRNKTPTVFTHIQTTNRFSRDSSVFVRIRVSCVFENDAIFAHFKL